MDQQIVPQAQTVFLTEPALAVERSAQPCEWIVSADGRYDDCNCHRLATQHVAGRWWCETHAHAVNNSAQRLSAVVLARVSSEDQADNGYSLPTQIEGCLRYASLNKMCVLPEHVFIEDISGTVPIAERPTHQKALTVLKRRDAQAVLTHQVDRLSRDIVDMLASVRMWLRANTEVHSCDIGKINSELDIVLVIKSWQGSDERMKIIERCTRGRNGKAKSGKVVGSGRPPYGYRYEDGALIILEEEAKWVRLIFHWYTEGDETGKRLPLRKLAYKLSTMRIPAPGERKHSHRDREPGIWATETVHVIIRNETYVGVLRYGKRIGKGFGGGIRPLNEQIIVRVPPIVDRQVWERAQELLVENRRMSLRNCRYDYLLRGMVFCSNGHRMHGSQRHKHYAYACPVRYSHHAGLEKRCEEKGVRGDWLDAFAWEYVTDLLADEKQFENALRQAQQKETDALAPKRERLAIVQDLIEDCEKEVKEVARAYARKSDGAVGRALEIQISEVEARLAALEQERDLIEASLAHRQFSEESIQAAMEFRKDVLEGMDYPDFATKRRVLELLQFRVIIKNKTAQAQCLIPTADLSIMYKSFYKNYTLRFCQ